MEDNFVGRTWVVEPRIHLVGVHHILLRTPVECHSLVVVVVHTLVEVGRIPGRTLVVDHRSHLVVVGSNHLGGTSPWIKTGRVSTGEQYQPSHRLEAPRQRGATYRLSRHG